MQYISLKEATKYCHYSQDYLKLRARQGKLKAVKIGRNWVTAPEWVRAYSGGNIQEIKGIQSPDFRMFGRSDLLKFKIGGLFLLVILIITGVFINFDIFSEYLQWQTANLGGVFDEGLKIIPGKIIEMK